MCTCFFFACLFVVLLALSTCPLLHKVSVKDACWQPAVAQESSWQIPFSFWEREPLEKGLQTRGQKQVFERSLWEKGFGKKALALEQRFQENLWKKGGKKFFGKKKPLNNDKKIKGMEKGCGARPCRKARCRGRRSKPLCHQAAEPLGPWYFECQSHTRIGTFGTAWWNQPCRSGSPCKKWQLW